MARLNLKQFKVCFDRSPIAFCVIRVTKDKTGRYNDFIFEYANEALAKLEGIPLDNLVGKHFYQIFYNANLKWLIPYGQAAYEGKTSSFVEYSPEIRKHLQIQAYQIDEGYAVVALMDVTEQMTYFEEDLKALITLENNTYSLYSVNITGDGCRVVFKKDTIGKKEGETGTFSEFIEYFAKHIISEEEKTEFRRRFNLQNLQSAFLYGKKSQSTKATILAHDGKKYLVDVALKLRKNPFSGIIEGALGLTTKKLAETKNSTATKSKTKKSK
jgi:hypothetical protein